MFNVGHCWPNIKPTLVNDCICWDLIYYMSFFDKSQRRGDGDIQDEWVNRAYRGVRGGGGGRINLPYSTIVVLINGNHTYCYFLYRAGRCQPGICYHLFSNVRFESFQEFQEPEILRHPLQVVFSIHFSLHFFIHWISWLIYQASPMISLKSELINSVHFLHISTMGLENSLYFHAKKCI